MQTETFRKAPAKAIAAAPERPASGNQCERIERKAVRRKCSKALAPILDIIRKNPVHASLKAVDDQNSGRGRGGD
jgi:hypothetical protein